MELINKSTWGTEKYEEYLVSRKETDDLVIEKIKTIVKDTSGLVTRSYTRNSKHQKFLCVNGPMCSQKLTWQEAKKQGYSQYNCADMRRGHGRNNKLPKAVLIFFAVANKTRQTTETIP